MPATLVGDVPVATSVPSAATMLTVVGFAFASPHVDGSTDISVIAHPIIVGVQPLVPTGLYMGRAARGGQAHKTMHGLRHQSRPSLQDGVT